MVAIVRLVIILTIKAPIDLVFPNRKNLPFLVDALNLFKIKVTKTLFQVVENGAEVFNRSLTYGQRVNGWEGAQITDTNPDYGNI